MSRGDRVRVYESRGAQNRPLMIDSSTFSILHVRSSDSTFCGRPDAALRLTIG